jgi:O-antigen/teichoic acid export membrane protein
VGVLLGPHIGRVLAPAAYEAGGWIAMLFVLGQFWIGLTNLLVIGIHKARRTAQLLPVFGWGALLNLALLFAAAPLIGVAAAGLGFLAGSIASAWIAFRYSNRYLSRPFSVRLLIWTLGATFALALAWWGFAVVGRDSVATLNGAAAAMAVGLIVVFALVAAIALGSLAPGRLQAMWHQVRHSLRLAGG